MTERNNLLMGEKCSLIELNYKLTQPFPSGKDFNQYFHTSRNDFRFIKEFFPLLKICILPTVKPRQIFLYGWLLPAELCEFCTNEIDITRYGFYIYSYYPIGFPEDDIEVEDIFGTINWSLIPVKHRHINYVNGRLTGLCTHHPYGEINDVPSNHRSVKILMSAWKLYYQCIQYINSGVWDLPDLPHGNEALPKLNKRFR